MSILSRSRLRKAAEGLTRRRCRAACSLVTAMLFGVVSQPSAGSTAPPYPVDNEDQVTAQRNGYKNRRTYGGPGRRIGGAGSTRRTHATDDNCYAAAGKESSFLNVFANDALKWQSTVEWSTVHGHAELAESGDDWGFNYRPNPENSEDQIYYRIVSPDDPQEYSEATVNIYLRTGPEGCAE